jgi:hypothetical protein
MKRPGLRRVAIPFLTSPAVKLCAALTDAPVMSLTSRREKIGRRLSYRLVTTRPACGPRVLVDDLSAKRHGIRSIMHQKYHFFKVALYFVS